MSDILPQSEVFSEMSLWENYAAAEGSYDEAFDAAGALRPAWADYFQRLTALGRPEIRRRWDQAQRSITESGVVFNPRGDVRSSTKLWGLDPIPHLITTEDWRLIEAAVVQRATLLNHVLTDLHGQQLLVREGHMPADLLFANPGFLRPCHGMKPPGGAYLHFYAADIARRADGRFVVMADRSQAPSGAGYARENRIIISRTFPEIFHESHVQRLVTFFQTLQGTLRRLAPANEDNPRIVVLTPGPQNETYFEHVYLARHLGYPLVEGTDLTVRDNHVYVKTLGGLMPVHVILRRVNDTLCDPLQLRYDSMVGIPGLVQAVWSGNVTIANALGSGLVGSYGFMASMDRLAHTVLGQDLLISNIDTRWCGQREGMEFVQRNLRDLVIKEAFPGIGAEPVYGPNLNQRELRDLAARIEARPSDYIGQEIVKVSTTPSLQANGVEPRSVILRVYAVATPDGYQVMPGGLARISGAPEGRIVSMKKGGSSKDTWVLSDGPVGQSSLAQHHAATLTIVRSGVDQPSRVADNLFWLGRYVERAEATARILRSVLIRFTDEAEFAALPELPSLIRILLGMDLLDPVLRLKLDRPGAMEAVERDLPRMICDPNRLSSLRANVDALRRSSWIVRDRIATDTWRVLNRLDEEIPVLQTRRPMTLADALNQVNQVILTLAAFSGLAMESMTRGLGWRFLDIGRRLERAIQMSTLLNSSLSEMSMQEEAVLRTVLEVADSSITYRSRYLSTLQPEPVIDLLLLDESNPRSVAYQLSALLIHLEALPRDRATSGKSPEERLVNDLISTLRICDLNTWADVDSDKKRRMIIDFSQRLDRDVPEISNRLSRSYFSHTESFRQIGISPVEEKS